MNNVFGSWWWNGFIFGPVLSTLGTKIPNDSFQGKSFSQQTMIDVALTWEDGDKKEALVFTVANHMKKCYLNWNKDTVDDAVIFEHLYILFYIFTGACIGIFFGGYILKRLQLRPKGAVQLVIFFNILCLSCYAMLFFFGCENIKMAGTTMPYFTR